MPGRFCVWLAGLLVLFVVPCTDAAPLDLGAPAGAEATVKIGPRADRYEIPAGAFSQEERPMLQLSGSVIWRAYRIDDPDLTVAAVAQGYRERVSGDAYKVLLDCHARACGGFDFRFGISLLPAPAMRMDVQNFEQISVRRVQDDSYASILISRALKAIYVQIVTVEASEAAVAITNAPEAPEETDKLVPQRPSDRDLMQELEEHGHVQLDGIEFATGGAQLSESSAIKLDQIANLLINQSGLNIMIVGHSDNEGGLDANIALSRSRADAVLGALVARGVSARRMEARGIGFLSPLVSNATPEGRAMNRRVEIVLSD